MWPKFSIARERREPHGSWCGPPGRGELLSVGGPGAYSATTERPSSGCDRVPVESVFLVRRPLASYSNELFAHAGTSGGPTAADALPWPVEVYWLLAFAEIG